MPTYTEELADQDQVEIAEDGSIVPIGALRNIPAIQAMMQMELFVLRKYACMCDIEVNKFWNKRSLAHRIAKEAVRRKRFGVRPPKHTFYDSVLDTPPFSD